MLFDILDWATRVVLRLAPIRIVMNTFRPNCRYKEVEYWKDVQQQKPKKVWTLFGETSLKKPASAEQIFEDIAYAASKNLYTGANEQLRLGKISEFVWLFLLNCVHPCCRAFFFICCAVCVVLYVVLGNFGFGFVWKGLYLFQRHATWISAFLLFFLCCLFITTPPKPHIRNAAVIVVGLRSRHCCRRTSKRRKFFADARIWHHQPQQAALEVYGNLGRGQS